MKPPITDGKNGIYKAYLKRVKKQREYDDPHWHAKREEQKKKWASEREIMKAHSEVVKGYKLAYKNLLAKKYNPDLFKTPSEELSKKELKEKKLLADWERTECVQGATSSVG